MRATFGSFAVWALAISCAGAAGSATAAAAVLPGLTGFPAAMVQHKRVLSYPFKQVWPTAIRYLRVDRGYKVSDKDDEAGFILFEFELSSSTPSAPRTGRGSLEMFKTTDPAGRASVQVSVSTTSGPLHLPHAILEGLAAKILAERGQPLPPPKQDKPKDKDKDKDKPEDEPGKPPMMPPPEEPGN